MDKHAGCVDEDKYKIFRTSSIRQSFLYHIFILMENNREGLALKKKLLAFLAILLIVLSIAPVVNAGHAPGHACKHKPKADGSKRHPYVLCTMEDFALLRDHPDAHFVLGADVDFNGEQWPYSIYMFSGTLDGKNHTIRNFHARKGMFSRIEQGGVVKRLKFEDSFIYEPEYRNPDGATLAISNYGTIDRVEVNGEVRIFTGAYGIVQSNHGTIKHSRMTGTVSGHYGAGGIAGSNSGTIRHCSADVYVDGSYNAGAIVSSNSGVIEHVVAEGIVDVNVAVGGGIAGFNSATGLISKSVSFADVYYGQQFPEESGLIVGVNEGTVSKTYSYGQLLPGW